MSTLQLFQLSRDEAIRRTRLRAELETLDSALENLLETMREFREANCIFVNGSVAYVSDDPNQKQKLAATWHGFWKSRDAILAQRNITLAELAEMAKQ